MDDESVWCPACGVEQVEPGAAVCRSCEQQDDLLCAPCGRCGDPTCFGGCEVGVDESEKANG